MIFSVAYLLARRLLGCLIVLARREASKDAELLVLHETRYCAARPDGSATSRPTGRGSQHCPGSFPAADGAKRSR